MENSQDTYVHGMDWMKGELSDFELSNYRKYQFDLIGKYIGKQILEVGSGDRSFTAQITRHCKNIEKLVSIEPSQTLLDLYKDKYKFPDHISFNRIDVFDLTPKEFGLFDTAIFVHVLEHIENDRDALNHTFDLLLPGGLVLIEVPALPALFSVHDEMLGHYRRYNKRSLLSIIDTDRYVVRDLWYQDMIGILGSIYYFKLRKIQLQSAAGVELAKNQGQIYDRFLIPLQKGIEKFLRFPVGLSLTAVLERR